MTQPAPTLAYADSPPSRTRRILFYYLLFFAITLVLTAFFWLYLTFWIPRFKETFRDFNVTLPYLTQRILSVADWLPTLPGVACSIFVTSVIPILPGFLVATREERWKRFCGTLLVAFVLFITATITFLFIQFSVQLPLVKLMESIRGI